MENGRGKKKKVRGKKTRTLPKKDQELETTIEECMHRNIQCPQLLNRHYLPFSSETYGEASFDVISKILEKVQLSSNDTFVDLGAGVGQVVLQVAGATLCKFSFGIEIASLPFNYSIDMLSMYKSTMKNKGLRHGEIALYFGNFLEARFRQLILSATVIFVNNFSFTSQLNYDLGNMLSEIKHDATVISSATFDFGRDKSFLPVSFEKVGEVEGKVSWTGKEVTYHIQKVKRNAPSIEIGTPKLIFEGSPNCQNSTPDLTIIKEEAASDDEGSHEADITAAEMNVKVKEEEVLSCLKTSSQSKPTDANVELNDPVGEPSAFLRGSRAMQEFTVAHAEQSEPVKVELRVINPRTSKPVKGGRFSFHSDITDIQKFLSEQQLKWEGNIGNDKNKVVRTRKRKVFDQPVQAENSEALENLKEELNMDEIDEESEAGVNWEVVENGDVAQSEPNETVWGDTARGERVFARSKGKMYQYARIIGKELGLDCTWKVKFVGKMSSEEANVSFKHILPINVFGIGTEVTYDGEGDLSGESAQITAHKMLRNPGTGTLKVEHEIDCGGKKVWCSHGEISLTENQAVALRKRTDRFNTTKVRKDIQLENIVESRTRRGNKLKHPGAAKRKCN